MLKLDSDRAAIAQGNRFIRYERCPLSTLTDVAPTLDYSLMTYTRYLKRGDASLGVLAQYEILYQGQIRACRGQSCPRIGSFVYSNPGSWTDRFTSVSYV
jgi:hypothetical protein